MGAVGRRRLVAAGRRTRFRYVVWSTLGEVVNLFG